MVKKLILLGLGLSLLVGLPLAIFVLQNQTQTKSGAEAETKFSLGVPSNPVNVGDTLDIPINVDPQGKNDVSFVKITFTYDATYLDKSGDTPVTVDPKYLQLEKPSITCNDSSLCTVTFTISVGADKDIIIKTATTIAHIKLVAKANTSPDTKLQFVAGQNQALSTGAGDQAAENVYQAGQDATITIGNSGGGGNPTPTPGGNNPTPTPGGNNPTPTPGNGGGGGGSGGSSGDGGQNAATVNCTSLTASAKSGNPPLDVTFTTVGASTNDSITKISINYGDGLVDSIASGSGIGTGDVNAQTDHSYSRNGTFTATATLTTSTGVVSNPSSCSQTITVGSGANGNLPPTGPGDTILYVGLGGAALAVLGVAILAGL